MFIFVFLLFVCICVLSIYTVFKVLEIEKDIETLYECYAKQLEKITLNHLERN